MSTLGQTPFTLVATGDAILTRRILQYEGTTDRFDRLLRTLRDADATVAHLEVVTPWNETPATTMRPVPSQYQFLSPLAGVVMYADESILDDLASMGVDLLTAASNHAFDFGHAGLEATIQAAERRNIAIAGIGRDAVDARGPTFRETPGGRVAVVNATTSVVPGSEATVAGPLLPGRPGVNPLALRWVVRATAAHIDSLRAVSEATGIEDVKGTWLSRENPAWTDDEAFHFFHQSFREAADPEDVGISYEPLEPDLEAYVRAVERGVANADWTVATLHCHQGPNGRRNVSGTPAFLRAVARECIDAGADAFVGTGPHVLRGIELYDGKPIFYSLGNFCYQTETIERLPTESFSYYGVDDDADPSALFDARYYDDDGAPRGGLTNEARWETIVPRCSFAAGGRLERIDLVPCTLGRSRPRASRGTPLVATGAEATRILDRVESLSEPFGTVVERDGDRGVVRP